MDSRSNGDIQSNQQQEILFAAVDDVPITHDIVAATLIDFVHDVALDSS